MSDIISIGGARQGDVLTINNRSAHAITYRVGCGDAGAVRFTISPGGIFQYIVGKIDPEIHMENISDTGVTPA